MADGTANPNPGLFPELITIAQLVAWTGMSESYWYSLRRDEIGPPYHDFGYGFLRYDPADVTAWFATQKVKGISDPRRQELREERRRKRAAAKEAREAVKVPANREAPEFSEDFLGYIHALAKNGWVLPTRAEVEGTVDIIHEVKDIRSVLAMLRRLGERPRRFTPLEHLGVPVSVQSVALVRSA